MSIYKLTAPRYNTLTNERFYQNIAGSLLDEIDSNREVRTILEVGAGTGFSTAVLKKRFPAAEITALEPCGAMMAYGRQRVPDVAWRRASVLELPRRPFDLVVASMSYHWLNAAERAELAEAAAGGVLAVAVSVTDRLEPEGAPRGIQLPKVSPSGNELLKKVVFTARPRSSQARRLRRTACLSQDLSQTFSRVRAAHLTVSETFTAADFAEVLYVRGALSALFDGGADHARRALSDVSAGAQEIGFSWNIALLTAGS